MADADRTSTHSLGLLEELRRRPYHFDFFQALRRLECEFNDKPRLGKSVRASDDAVRLCQEPSLRFAPSTLARFESGKGGRPWRLSVLFFGLFGPNGPLPLHLTEYARDRIRNSDDQTLSRFLDVFHHRILSLFYRGWADSNPTVHFDRPDSDRFATYVGSAFGIGMESLRDRDPVPDFAKFFHAGLFANQARTASGLRTILQSFFGVPVEIDEFVGQWMDLPGRYRCRLGASPETGTLGRTAILGKRVWDCQQKFRIVMGPMTLDDYERLLPGGESMDRLRALVRNYIGDELTYDVRLVLERESVPPLRLGATARVGWTTWLTSRPADSDMGQMVVNPAC